MAPHCSSSSPDASWNTSDLYRSLEPLKALSSWSALRLILNMSLGAADASLCLPPCCKSAREHGRLFLCQGSGQIPDLAAVALFWQVAGARVCLFHQRHSVLLNVLLSSPFPSISSCSLGNTDSTGLTKSRGRRCANTPEPRADLLALTRTWEILLRSSLVP